MLRFSTWKNSILRLVDTLKYLSTYQLWSKDFAVSEVEQQSFYPGMKTHKAGWSGKGCGGVGKGLWHEEATCAIWNCRGSWLPSLKAQGCSLPAPHHSGHGSKNSKEVRITVIQCFGARPGHATRQSESWIIPRYILIRGKASLRMLYFYTQIFHESDFWGELTSLPLILVAQIVPICELGGAAWRTWLDGYGRWNLLFPNSWNQCPKAASVHIQVLFGLHTAGQEFEFWLSVR